MTTARSLAVALLLAATSQSCGGELDGRAEDLSESHGGEACDIYCSAVWQHCKDAYRPYETLDQCHAVCPTFATTGELGDTVGNTLQCRLTYALYARRDKRRAFCREAWPDGGSLCGP